MKDSSVLEDTNKLLSPKDVSEIEDVLRYVVSYMGKRHNTSQAEIDSIQNIIMK
jgi:hypothetical protein